MRSLLILMIVLAPIAARADGVTVEQCEADYAAMIDAAVANRQNSLKHLEYQLRRTADDEQSARLIAEMEGAWDLEEQFRNPAANAHRDCLKAANPRKS